ncbi:MAG: twin-arginine translocation signal domain-containing protein [Methanobacteriota archaeon]
MDRRTFVKACLATAGLGAIGAGLGPFAASVRPPVPARSPRLPFVGSGLLRGPAQVGLPLVPLAVRHGRIVGLATKFAWYGYCPDPPVATAEEGPIRFSVKRRSDGRPTYAGLWYEPLDGTPMEPAHFAAVGDGAVGAWDIAASPEPFLVVVVRVDPARFRAPAVVEPDLTASVREHGLVAFRLRCVHACFVPGYKEDPIVRRQDGGKDWDKIVCTTGHGSVFDPTRLEIWDGALLPP